MKSLILNIKHLRQQRNLTQKELASAMGITQGGIANWEAEVSLPGTRQLPQLAKVLGVPIGELFAEEEDDEEGGQDGGNI